MAYTVSNCNVSVSSDKAVGYGIAGKSGKLTNEFRTNCAPCLHTPWCNSIVGRGELASTDTAEIDRMARGCSGEGILSSRALSAFLPGRKMNSRRFALLFLQLILVFGTAGSAFAISEICGNGLDDDGVGGDQACPDPDKDNDGYQSGVNDCDDYNYKIYPGVVTTSGCPAGQTHTCQSNGQYSACTAATVCEAAAGSTCKYIDCGSGSDSNSGTFAAPWKSFKLIGNYENSSSRPSGWYNVQPGDVIYLKGSGTCSDWYDAGPTQPNVILQFTNSGQAGKPIVLKRYPGSTAVIDPPFTSSLQGHVFRLSGLSYVKIEDFDITGSYASPLYITDGSNIEVARVRCHDTAGTSYDNIACLNAASGPNSHYIHHNEFFNVYDTDHPGADNVSLIVYFGGQNNRIEYNRMYYTNPPNYGGPVFGRCFKYKHPATSGTETLLGNQFWNCDHVAIETSAIGMRVSRNLFVNGAAGAAGYHCGDTGGGTSYCKDSIVEYNTFVNSRAVAFRESVNANLGSTIFRRNVVVDNSPGYNSENGFFRIERYGSDGAYTQFLAANAINSSENCYYNPNAALGFDLFGDGGNLGGMLSFTAWKALGFDSGSYNENPGLDVVHRPTAAHCTGFGWLSGNSAPPGAGRPNPPTGLNAVVLP